MPRFSPIRAGDDELTAVRHLLYLFDGLSDETHRRNPSCTPPATGSPRSRCSSPRSRWRPRAAAARSRRRDTTTERLAATRSRSASATSPTSRTRRRSSACRTGRSRTSSAPNVTLKTSTYNSGTDETTAILAGALDAAFVGPNPAINAYQKSNGTLIRIVVGRRVGRRVPRREAVDHERGRPQGQEDRDAVARQHPGRRAAHLAEVEGPQDRQRRRR